MLLESPHRLAAEGLEIRPGRTDDPGGALPRPHGAKGPQHSFSSHFRVISVPFPSSFRVIPVVCPSVTAQSQARPMPSRL
jgi:hypothetical protein